MCVYNGLIKPLFGVDVKYKKTFQKFALLKNVSHETFFDLFVYTKTNNLPTINVLHFNLYSINKEMLHYVVLLCVLYCAFVVNCFLCQPYSKSLMYLFLIVIIYKSLALQCVLSFSLYFKFCVLLVYMCTMLISINYAQQ